MGVIFTPKYYTATPANFAIYPYRGCDAEWKKYDVVDKAGKYLCRKPLPKDSYIMIQQPYPKCYSPTIVPKLLKLFHYYGYHAIIRTNNPHSTDYKFLDSEDIYAVTISDHSRRDEITLDFNNDRLSQGPTTMSERVCRMFDAQIESGCRTMVIFSENASVDYIKSSFKFIKADLFAVEGNGITEREKQEIRELAGNRWCKFTDDGADISATDTKNSECRRMREHV